MSEERIAAIRARVNGPSKSYSVRYSIQTLREFPLDVVYLLTELENQAEVIRHLQDAAVTMREMRDEARAAALEEAALIADPIEPECQCDRCLALRMIAKRIREALAPPQAEEP